MTTDDTQIDVLLRRYAGQSKSISATEHLDADELNAFAEGVLPDATRSRYVSHLADCDDCRKVVSQLAISSGALLAPEATAGAAGYAWWKSLSGLFSPLRLKYAAFALLLIAAAGVVFLVTRRPAQESSMVAQNEQTKQTPVTALKPTEDGAPQGNSEPKSALADRPTPAAQPSQSLDGLPKADQAKTGEEVSPPKPGQETDTTTSPALAANKKAAEPAVSSPSYAPPPPPGTERAEQRAREEKSVGGIVTMGGPRKMEQQQQSADKQQTINGGRAGAGKDVQSEDDSRRVTLNQAPATRAPADEKVKGPRRDVDNVANSRNSNEVRGNASNTKVADEAAPETAKEKRPETRSAGGRSFRRQGNSWVDTKFKSSMTLKSVSRGSSDFEALDSGLRSIAQQLGGEVIVVWKGKAYVIR